MDEEGVFVETVELAPEPPPSGPMTWIRENLAYSWTSAITTVVLSLAVLAGLRGFFGWVISPIRKWSSVTANARLLMVQAYPDEHFIRVWIAVGVVFALAGLSFAVWRTLGMVSVDQITRAMIGAGVVLAGAAALTPRSVEIDAGVETINAFITPGRVLLFFVGVAIVALALFWKRMVGDQLREQTIAAWEVGALVLALIVAVLWTIKLPVQEVSADGFKEISNQVLAGSTKLPWTVLIGVLAGSYALGAGLRDVFPALRRILTVLWTLSFPVILMVILRAPDIDWSTVLSVDLPIFLAVGVFVSLLLWVFGNPTTGEWKYLVSAVWLIASVLWVFFSWYLFDARSPLSFSITAPAADVLQVIEFKFPLILGAIFALAAPSFGGPPAARWNYIRNWWIALAMLIISFRLGAAASILELSGSAFVGGLFLTFTLAIAGIVLSFPLGVLLALGRASTMPIIRMISTTYIELVRSVPLITWLYIGANLLNLFLQGVIDIYEVVRAIIAIALFSAAYLAENVRGGLQSIPKGQYEAADAVGMGVVQKTVLITLPQALRAVVPALVGQVIALFKDTSLVAIIGLFDLLFIARNIIPSQSANLGSLLETTVSVAVIYWIFTFTFSRSSLRLEKRLGLGTR